MMRYVWMTWRYLVRMLPGVLAALALYGCLYPWRRQRLKAAGLVSPRLREAMLALFWMFCGGMVMLTLTPWGFDLSAVLRWGWAEPFFWMGDVNLVPFQTFASEGVLLYTLLGNIVMFLPFGFFPAMLRADAGIGPYGQKYTWKRALVTGLCVTGFIECWQLLVGRAFDIDDLMLNTLGTLCGFWLWLLLRRAAPAFAERFWVKANSVT